MASERTLIRGLRPLTARLSVCEEHWFPAKSRCQSCPLFNVCTAHLPQPFGHSDLEKREDALESLARKSET